jgi:hypothetical protein
MAAVILTPKFSQQYACPSVQFIHTLKGQCHEMDIFLCLNILISTCVSADGFQCLSKASLPYTFINFLFASLK